MVPVPATEAMLAACGVPFTSLRNGFYASSAVMMVGRAYQTGEIVAPPDGPVSWTTHDDLADAAVIALTEPARLQGITPALTGPAALDLAGLGQIIAELTGRPVKRVLATEETHRAAMVQHGVPEERADMMLGLFRASFAGEFAKVDPTLGELLVACATC